MPGLRRGSFSWKFEKEFQPVEYIQSYGAQHIDSGIPGTNGYIAEAKYEYTALGGTSDDKYVLGSSGSYPNYLFYIGKQGISSSHWHACACKDTWMRQSGISTNTQYTTRTSLLNTGITMTVNGNTNTTSYSGTYSNGYNLWIFAQNNGSTSGANHLSGKLYYLKIWDSNNELIRDYIPCYRIADGEIGLLERVNNVFYTNQGSGDFTKGPDV